MKNRQATNEIDEIIRYCDQSETIIKHDNIRDLLNEENHDKYYKWKKLPPVETYLKKLLSVCHKCGIDFGGYKSVLNHWTKDHGEEEPKFQCKFSICEYVCHKGDQVRIDQSEVFVLTFDQPQLKDHVNNHLLNAGRHTKCPMCGKVFNKAKLTPHIKQVKHSTKPIQIQ